MYTTDAIILKKEPIGEADLLVTALTDRFVRIRLVAQGARKLGAKLKGHLEPVSISRLSFVVGRNNYRLIGAELIRFLSVIKNAPERFRVASEVISALDSALFEDRSEGGGNFFALARETLEFLNEPSITQSDCEKALLWFKAGFLKESGLLPEELMTGMSLASETTDSKGTACSSFVYSDSPKFAHLASKVSDIFLAHLPNRQAFVV